MSEEIVLVWPAPSRDGVSGHARSTGRYVVTTSSSSRYLVDLDRGVVVRFRGREPVDDFRSVELRRDGDDVALASVACRVGAPMVLILEVRGDGVPTVRTTTPVVRIEPVPAVADWAG